MQNYNRYSYINNTPLSAVDYSGYGFFKSLFKSVIKFSLNPSAKNAFNLFHNLPGQKYVDKFIMSNSVAYAIGQVVAAYYGGPYGAALYASYYTYQLTGSMTEAFKAGAISFGTAFAFNAVGDAYPEAGSFGNIAGHAIVGCGSAAASGGSCGAGALAGGFSAAAAPYISTSWGPVGGVIASAVVGGTASELGGGKFANGAVTGAFGYLFNHCMHAGNCWQAFKDSASMATDWALGTGQDTRVFGTGSTQVTDMMDAPGVNAARERLYNTNAEAVTNYRASFGLIDYLTTSSPTQQFVGSYRVDVFTVNQGADLMFVLTNNSSFKSFAYGMAPAWERSTIGPGGNMRQTYWWTEPKRK